MANGLIDRNRTLGELMAELRARLSYVTQGPAAKNNDALIKSFLQEAHDYVYGELDMPDLRKKTQITILAGSFLYDWNNDIEDEEIDPSNVISVWLIRSNNIREMLVQGITERDRSFNELRQYPQKYDNLDGQIELWPIPDQEYQLLIEYRASQPRFDRTSDRPGVPDRLVFLYALTVAKGHLKHPDAQVAAEAFKAMLNKEKALQKENKRYFIEAMHCENDGKYVVRTANGYSLGS